MKSNINTLLELLIQLVKMKYNYDIYRIVLFYITSN